MDRIPSVDLVVRHHPVILFILSALNPKSPVLHTKRGGDVLVAVPKFPINDRR
jgi:hypothetical protein